MIRIVGGLLIITVMSNITIWKHEIIKLQAYKATTQIISGTSTEEVSVGEEEIFAAEVESMMENVDANIHTISVLLKDKYNVNGKIAATMCAKAKAKAVMTEEQIELFQDFSKNYAELSESVNLTLNEIEGKLTLKNAQESIFKEENGFYEISRELEQITKSQSSAITWLKSIIDMGNRTLAAL